MNVSGVMPVKGRVQETLALLPRLIQTAGAPLELVVVVDDDNEIAMALKGTPYKVLVSNQRRGYWKSMSAGAQIVGGDMIVNLANDLLPGREWLARLVSAYEKTFQSTPAIMGINDGIHPGTHCAHFMASMALLRSWYSGALYPVMYDHLWGDSEIVMRAMAQKVFAVAPWAVLYHNHPASGKMGDRVYEIGHAHIDDDYALFNRRRANSWTGL